MFRMSCAPIERLCHHTVLLPGIDICLYIPEQLYVENFYLQLGYTYIFFGRLELATREPLRGCRFTDPSWFATMSHPSTATPVRMGHC